MPAPRKPAPKPAPKPPAAKPAAKPPAPKPAAKPAPKPAAKPAPRSSPGPAAKPAQKPARKPTQPARKPAPKPVARKPSRAPGKPAVPRVAKPSGRTGKPARGATAQRKPAPKPKITKRPPTSAARPAGARLAPRAYAGSSAQKALWAHQSIAAAGYAKIPFDILWGVFGKETRWGNYIGTSSAQATGLMQFIPDTARRYNYPQTNYPNSAQSQQQFTAAAIYLRDLRKEHGTWDGAIIAYSGGGYNLHDVETTAATYKNPFWGQSTAPAQQVQKYYNPLAHARVTAERIDQGVDYAGSGYYVAIADGVVTMVSGQAWQPYGNYLEYKITTPGPLDGVYIYYAEGINPVVHDGEQIRAGSRLCDLIPGWRYGTELGFAAGSGAESYYRYHDGGYHEGDATRPGIAFSNLVQRLGGPPGRIEGAVVGRFPAYMQSGVPDGSITANATEGGGGIGGGQIFDAGGVAAAYTFPQNDYSAWVQLQRGIGGGAHHSHASWFYVRGITFVPLKK